MFKYIILFYFHVVVSWIWYNGTENKRRKRDRNYSWHSWPCITHKKEIHGNICQNTILCVQSWAHHFEISLGNQQGCNLQINVKTIDLYIPYMHLLFQILFQMCLPKILPHVAPTIPSINVFWEKHNAASIMRQELVSV